MKLSLDRKDEESFDHIVPLAPAAVDVLRAPATVGVDSILRFKGCRKLCQVHRFIIGHLRSNVP